MCGYKYILIMNIYVVMSTNIWLFTLMMVVHNFYKIAKIYVLPFSQILLTWSTYTIFIGHIPLSTTFTISFPKLLVHVFNRESE